MAPRTLPGLGINGDWVAGENGFATTMNENWRKLSLVTQCVFIDFVAALPASPVDGDIHIMSAGVNINRFAIRDQGSWSYLTPQEGWISFNKSEGALYSFSGSAWVLVSSGGGGIADAPSNGNLYGRKNAGWEAIPAGGGGGIADAPSNGKLYGRKDAGWEVIPAGGGGATDFGSHRWWRVRRLSSMDANYVSLCELELGENVASGGTPIASSQYDGSYGPANVFDGDTGTNWSTATGALANAYVGYTFAAPVSVNSVTLRVGASAYLGHMPISFVVEYSDDGVAWTEAWTDATETWTTAYEAREFVAPNASAPTSLAQQTDVDLSVAPTDGQRLTFDGTAGKWKAASPTSGLSLATVTASRALALVDVGKYLRVTAAAGVTLTIPTNATAAIPIGSTVNVRQAGAGQVTIAGAGGVTVNSAETLKTRKSGSNLTLIKVGTNEWDLTGDMEALP